MNKTLLTFCAALSLFGEVSAQTFEVDGLQYTVNGEGTVAVTDEATKQSGTVTIPSSVANEGTTYTVNSIGAYAFQWSNATGIVFPETLDSIGYCAFSSSAIGNVTLPSQLKHIGGYAFSSCKNMTAIDIPASVEAIGDNAFFGGYGSNLSSVTLHEGLKRIGRSVFYSQKLTSIDIPTTVDSIGKSAFLNCAKLETVNLHDGLRYMGDGVFYGCSSLTAITLPGTLEEVGDELFMNAKSLPSINIPASLATIGNCFVAGTSVASIQLDEANAHFVLDGGVLYSKNFSLLVAAPVKGLTSLSVNAKCLGVNGGAFMGSDIQTITLPQGLVAIDDYAFCQSQLASISFPSSLVYVGEQAFASTQLTSVSLPVNFPYINDGEFAGCTKLKEVTIPSGVKGIYNHAFMGCTSLASITVKSATAPTLEDWYDDYDHPFYNVSSSTKVYIPKGSKSAYEKEYWDDYLTLVEGENGTLTVKSTSPADDDALGTFNYYSFSVTFNEDITLVNAAPEVYVRKDSEISGSSVAPASWKAITEAGNTLTVMGMDEDGFMDGWMPDKKAEYYIIIPAGTVKNEAGDENERIVIRLLGKELAGIESAAASKAAAKVAARFTLDGQRVSSPKQGVNIVRLADGSVRKVLVK